MTSPFVPAPTATDFHVDPLDLLDTVGHQVAAAFGPARPVAEGEAAPGRHRDRRPV